MELDKDTKIIYSILISTILISGLGVLLFIPIAFANPITNLTVAQELIVEDVYSHSPTPDTNKDGVVVQVRSADYALWRRGYVAFNFSSLGADSISSATFNVWGYSVQYNIDDDLDIYYCNDIFDETTLTWNNQDTEVINCGGSPIISDYDYSAGNNNWYQFNLTTEAIAELADDQVFTIKLRYDLENEVNSVSFGWYSKDHTNESYRPYLNITYETAPVDSCSCPGLNNNWEIDMSDYCVIQDDCDLGTGTLSFTGSGNVTINSSVDTTNLGDPGANGILYVADSCLLTID